MSVLLLLLLAVGAVGPAEFPGALAARPRRQGSGGGAPELAAVHTQLNK